MKRELASKAVKMTNVQLRQHNNLLRKNIKRIVTCSTDNEKAQERMEQMENLVFDAPALKVMFDSIISQGRRIFEINLICVLLEPDLARFYPDDYKEDSGNIYLESENVEFRDADKLTDRFGDSVEPVLRGALRRGAEEFFINGRAGRVKSEAIVPLVSGGKVIGSIAFGSSNQARFMEGYGSRFLKRLAKLITLKIELFRSHGPEWRYRKKEL